MKKYLLLILLMLMTTPAFALTPQDNVNKQNENAADIIICQYDSLIGQAKSIMLQMKNLQYNLDSLSTILQLNGVNWTGQDLATSTKGVNWESF